MGTKENLWLIRLDDTILGFVDLTFSTRGLCGLEIIDAEADFPFLIPGLIHGSRDPQPPDRIIREINDTIDEIQGYFDGRATDFAEVPLDLRGTPFQLQVWQELQKIPWGRTISYQGLARRLEKPGAARAVGRACGANPIPLIVPCHRVIAANGALGGYSSGLPRKRWLLAHEQLNMGAGPGSSAGI
jgi:methylated-DNA-[protein]-cysteine S-methyltransferase